MQEDEDMARWRARAQDQIGRNALPLSQAPQKPPEPRENPWPQRAATGAVHAVEAGLKKVQKELPAARNAGEKVAKVVGGAHIRAPAASLAAAQVAMAKDRKRAVAGVIGGRIGALAGEFSPLGPLGAFAGSIAGEAVTEGVYDHAGQIRDAVTSTAENVGDGLMRELRQYVPYDLYYWPGAPAGRR